MGILKWVLYLAILLTSIPVGILLSKLCNDELKQGKEYFRLFISFSLILLILTLIFYRNLTIILTIIYMIILVVILFLAPKFKIKLKK
jgi:hypothetical protein